ncbi:MAG: hypothetical protein XE04_1946 [Marinimicrobia bacterium 46_43]|nr:MAG: hypothetical protein XE04_1946 [Marinimicrobia bacterium 46_43]
MKSKIVSIFLILLFMVTPGFAVNKVGTSVAQFLKIGTSARALSMGEAAVADVRGLEALHYNAAGLAHHQIQEAMFTQSDWLASTGYLYAAGSMNLGRFGAVGVNVAHLDYGEMSVRTEAMQDGTGEYFSAQDLTIGLTYANRLTDRFSMGGQVKFIRQEIWHMSASTMAVDMGALFILPLKNFQLGMSITNFGGKLLLSGRDVRFYEDPDEEMFGNNDQIPAIYELDRWPLPIIFRIGLSGDVFSTEKLTLRMNVDALHPSDNLEYINLGTELEMFRTVFLRAGYRQLFLKDAEGGLSFGGGLYYPVTPALKIKADYAWCDYGRLHQAKMFTLSLVY